MQCPQVTLFLYSRRIWKIFTGKQRQKITYKMWLIFLSLAVSKCAFLCMTFFSNVILLFVASIGHKCIILQVQHLEVLVGTY